MAETINAFQMAQRQFDYATQFIKLKHGIVEMLRNPKRSLIVNFPVRMEAERQAIL